MISSQSAGTKLGFSPDSYDALDYSPVDTREHNLDDTGTLGRSLSKDSPGAAANFDIDKIPRSASYTQIPAVTGPDASFERNGVKRTFSENLIANPKSNTFRHASIKKISKRNTDNSGRPENDGLSRRLSMRSKPSITISGFQLGADEEVLDTGYQETPKIKSRSVSGSLARLKRQSWVASSSSESPSKRKSLDRRPSTADGDANHRPPSKPYPTTISDSNGISTLNDSIQLERNGVRGKRSRRPISSYLSLTSDATPSTPIIPKSLSTDRLPLSHAHTSSEKPPSLPSSKSFERLTAIGTESPRRKDDLWSAFRSLDADFQKFQSRSSSMKCAVVRTTLLPFLRSHSESLPHFSLRPEDLDRRVNVLNRWWTGLLEMINGRNGESVSGSDRPTILDAILAIMVRPEWSVSPSTNLSRSPKPSLKSRSTTSLKSTTSDFLTESVMHNIRNTYVQNLLAQMVFVVNKMSLRSVPASVVAFCSKATAYAYFYCDGVAEILVRLWSIKPDTLKRVCKSNKISKDPNIHSISEKISARFPPCTQKLAFSGVKSLIKYLRYRPHLPIAITYIPWDGAWTGRWAGRDTDLFYLFTKQYYDLLSQHLPEDVTTEETFCAPGYALMQAQILSIIDATLSRSHNQLSLDIQKGSTFDSLLVEADASAAVLPMSPRTMVRSMAENRLIMLSRDCLSANATITPRAKAMFAESFQELMKVAASRTSQFDHLACFTLCDFLDEAVVILVRFYQSSERGLGNFDWSYWMQVYRLMMASNNSMTEIRLCTLIYSLWNTMIGDEKMRKNVCLDWLLSEDTFGRQFNHWCPMVRAYFMRLLIWRIGRLDGVVSSVNLEILQTLLLRLQKVWRNFLFVRDDAHRKGSVAPTTAPCSPAPSRCLMIIRNEAPTPPNFLSFDSILPPTQSQGSQRAVSRSSILFTPPNPPNRPTSEVDKSSGGGKRRWGLLKNILPFTNSPPKQPTIANTASKSSAASQADTVPSLSKGDGAPSRQDTFQPNVNGDGILTSKPLQNAPQYRSHSFQFSLEWLERGQLPSREKRLYPPKLPVPAQVCLESVNLEQNEHTPLRPEGTAIGESKYAGRALAEWALLIAECHNFFERRKQEGVPDNSKVETPTLSVEPFRKT